MECGTIVRVMDADIRGIALNTVDDEVQVLHYDFTTTWQKIDDLEVLGHSDAIYKCMYEMMR